MATKMECIARWESHHGAHWVELRADNGAFTYTGNGCGGCLGTGTETQAIAAMQERVNAGYFLPDVAKVSLLRRT